MTAAAGSRAVGGRNSPPLRTASADDESSRVRLAAHAETSPEILGLLAQDPSVTVRVAVAINRAAPPDVDRVLASDADERVRALLAGKVAALVPGLKASERELVRQQVLATLAALVEDEAERVRRAIADVLATMPEAPRELILRLASDTAISVAGPVIGLSPLLTTEDLLALIDCPPTAATVLAVARRPGLPEAVSDAIVATANVAAIRTLLANPQAAIRESTLDALIARAASHKVWHAPLVRRPELSEKAARALSEIVQAELLAELAHRADLSPALATDLGRRLADRLTEVAGPRTNPPPSFLAEAESLAARGALTEQALLEAVRLGEPAIVAARLAVAARVPLAVVEHAMALRSAKGLISLLWRAGFSMKAAEPVQALLTGLAPANLLAPGPAGSFPLGVAEMRWHVDFLRGTQS